MEHEFTEDEDFLITYLVEENTILDYEEEEIPLSLQQFQADKDEHQYYWNTVIRLIPKEYRTDISNFIIFAHDSTAGFVELLDNDPTKPSWAFALNVLDVEPRMKRITTIIHELAHILTLGDEYNIPLSEKVVRRLMCELGYKSQIRKKKSKFISVYFADRNAQ